MPTPLTPIEKQQKKARDNLKIIHNRLISAFSFKQIKTWYDVFHHLGMTNIHDECKTKEVTFKELQSYLQSQKDELEKSFNNTKVEKIIEPILKVLSPSTQPVQSVVPFKKTTLTEDPERKDDFNDCTVLALANTIGITYGDAHKILAAESRIRGQGLRVDYLSEFLRDIGFELVPDINIALREVVLKYPIGRFYVRTDKHAFSIVDGTVIDHTPQPDNLELKRIYKWTGYKKKEFAPELKKEEFKPSSDNNYGYVPSPNANPSTHLWWHQKKATVEMLTKIKEGKTGILFVAGTGAGKTHATYAVMRALMDMKWEQTHTLSHIPYLVLTKSTVIEQHDRVARKCFNITARDCEITNIETLRSKAGQLWIREKVEIVGGEEVTKYEWKKHINPCVVFFDESQGGKNKKAKQSRIIYSYNDLPPGNSCLVSISATPFMRVSEAKAFAVSTHRPLEHLGFPKGTVLTNETWPSYSAIISSPSSPTEYNEAAVKRLMDDLEPWVVRVKGVRPQFEAINRVKIIQFESYEQRQFYDSAYDRFLEEKAKIDAAKEAGDVSGICYLVVLLKFAMAAEFCHASHFAKSMYEDVQNGKAAVAAVKFKQTLIEIVKILTEQYGVSRDKISLIWGGGQTQLNKKQKTKAKLKEKAAKLKEMGIDIEEFLGDLGLDEVEDRIIENLPEHLRLGPQNLDERQREIDKFQAGQSLFCIYTLKAGGVGLSLHHSDEFTQFKCRRKDSGYAFEEDIPKVPVRPRTTKVCVSYNAVELVQGVGRVPRLTSLSPTPQDILCFADTIEMKMAKIYSQKLRCLNPVVKQREAWHDIIYDRHGAVEAALAKTANVKDDESSTMIDEDEGDEDGEDNNGKE